MPLFDPSTMPSAVVAPGYSTAHGQTITGKTLPAGEQLKRPGARRRSASRSSARSPR